MKKCPDCSRELDRMSVICEYCGRLDKDKKSAKLNSLHDKQSTHITPKIKK